MCNEISLIIRGEKLEERERRFYLRAARELNYGAETISALATATTESEATRLMTTARERRMKYE